MTRLEEALLEVVSILNDLTIPYMLIGGLAVAEWGVPRSTLDVDITIWVEQAAADETVLTLASKLAARSSQPVEFTRKTRVFPARTKSGIDVDLVFALWPFERQAILEAVTRTIAGTPIRVASLEYLLFLKLVSDRPKDLDDVSRLLKRHRDQIDYAWLEQQVAGVAEALDQPEILDRYRRLRG